MSEFQRRFGSITPATFAPDLGMSVFTRLRVKKDSGYILERGTGGKLNLPLRGQDCSSFCLSDFPDSAVITAFRPRHHYKFDPASLDSDEREQDPNFKPILNHHLWMSLLAPASRVKAPSSASSRCRCPNQQHTIAFYGPPPQTGFSKKISP
ncbi:uncharacterized protein I303_103769 [Kwoniella dejecticola CBS 10117]|uniref:Uncharacterized protein n=1 Tax=Kwoniella dejecticola CBS 10117 TaxID=1296121 RepID=A0A1A6A7N4_9TREE|nr:uncharacterized protein I303_03787 [Kwoniella dejecticola CBS 10117]OBR86069.1 hypothetical protein I303_03787 [Kwoniella dejecticola CBS 10117]